MVAEDAESMLEGGEAEDEEAASQWILHHVGEHQVEGGGKGEWRGIWFQ